jgi:hypothetical protein
LQIKRKIVSSHTADSKPVKQEVNGTMILPPLVCPDPSYANKECTYWSPICSWCCSKTFWYALDILAS